MATISHVAGAAFLALAAAVQISGGTAIGGVSASAQGQVEQVAKEHAGL